MAPPDRCGGSSNVLNDSFLASDEVNESFKTPQPHLRTAPAVLLETWADPPGRQPPPLPGGRPQAKSIGATRRNSRKSRSAAWLSTSQSACGQPAAQASKSTVPVSEPG